MQNPHLPTARLRRFSFQQLKYTVLTGLMLILIVAAISFAIPRIYADQAAHRTFSVATAGDWPTYMNNTGRSGFNRSETIINQTSTPGLKIHWTLPSGGMIFSQPVVAKGMIYWGSFDGLEHAANLSGRQIWQQNLGAATVCVPFSPLGIVSSATVATVPVNGTNTSVVFVAGGNGNLYALNALTGAILWKTPVVNSSTNAFLWDSPLVVNNNVYIGSASTGEGTPQCKLRAGEFFELNASTGVIENTFNTVSAGCTGGGIWSSPTYDASDGSIYLTAGNTGGCATDHISTGIVKLNATTLAFEDAWQIPANQRLTGDADFGSTPTLFTATINGSVQKMVGAANKNGIFYVFNRASLSSGPVWTAVIAIPGACPECGQGSISSAAWDGTGLFVAGGSTTIKGVACKGSVQSLNPATGKATWQICLPKTVLGALSEVPGVLAVVDGANLTMFTTSTGAQLFVHNGSHYGSASISNGVLYVGSTIGKLYAFGL